LAGKSSTIFGHKTVILELARRGGVEPLYHIQGESQALFGAKKCLTFGRNHV